MDRNDWRSNIRVRLYRLWEQQGDRLPYSRLIENWTIDWDGETMFVYQGEQLLAKVSSTKVFLSENVESVHHFPITLIEESMAFENKLCYNSE